MGAAPQRDPDPADPQRAAAWDRFAAAEARLRAGPTPAALAAYADAVRALLRWARARGRATGAATAALDAVLRAVRAGPGGAWLQAADRLRGILIDLWW